MELNFPLYKELKELGTPEMGQDETLAVLAKISQLDSAQAETIYALMQAYAFETSARSKKTAKERFGGSWLLLKPKRGVRFKVDKIPQELKDLLATYILYITADERVA